MADYVELHVNSAFSFLEAASLPATLIERAVKLEMPAIALMDRNGVCEAARFHSIAEKTESRPILEPRLPYPICYLESSRLFGCHTNVRVSLHACRSSVPPAPGTRISVN